MKKIVINEQVETTTDLVLLLNHISTLIEEGYTNGYYPNWHIETT
jgi:hypothetical protein